MKNKVTTKATMKMNKLAIAILAFSLTQAANAESTQVEDNRSGTYWGLGIGSVIGAVIAGPPGAAIGATLGGSIGWGQDKDDALDQSLLELESNEQALNQSQAALNKNQVSLVKTKQMVSALSQANVKQTAELNQLSQQQADDTRTNKTLKAVIGHYAQEVYFRNGESAVPTYAESRLNRLSDFLKTHPNLNVSLKGYTDHRGAVDFNMALAQARVDGIKEVLITQGIDASRVSTQAIGEPKPVLPERIVLAGTNSYAPDTKAQADNTQDYVLDRRVSIELSMSHQSVQPLALFESGAEAGPEEEAL